MTMTRLIIQRVEETTRILMTEAMIQTRRALNTREKGADTNIV